MSSIHTYTANSRTALGSRNATKLRKAGIVPVTISRPGKASTHAQVDEKSAGHLVANVVHLCKLDLDGKQVTALRAAIATDVLTDRIKHIDLIEVDETTVIDGSCHTNKARYINHSCKPNAQAYIVDREVFIHAKRRIAPGEEITIDYGEDYWKEHIASKGCRCAPCAEARLESQSKVINSIGASAA